eukprot:5626181-Pyramimonas_sp.AAC.1
MQDHTANLPTCISRKAHYVLPFSDGHRRENDLQHHIEQMAATMHTTVIVLATNGQQQPACGDSTKREDADFWMAALAQGLIIAAVGGPPCGSWGPAYQRD